MATFVDFKELNAKYSQAEVVCLTRCETCKHHVKTFGRFGYRATCAYFETFIPNEMRYLEIDKLDKCQYEEAEWFKNGSVEYAVASVDLGFVVANPYFVQPKAAVPTSIGVVRESNPDYLAASQALSLSGKDCVSKCSVCEYFRYYASSRAAKCSKFPWNINLDIFLGAIDCKDFELWTVLKKQKYFITKGDIEYSTKALCPIKDFRGTVLRCDPMLFFDEFFVKRLTLKAR